MNCLRKKLRKEDACALLVQAVFTMMMAGMVLICLLLPRIAYAAKRETVSNLLLLPCAAIALAIVTPVIRRAANKASGRMPVLIALSLLGMFVQIFMASRYYFYTDWDVETIVECALSGITGTDISRHSNYFSMYQNNLVLVTLFSWVAKFAAAVGLKELAYFSLIVFQCLISWGTGVMFVALFAKLHRVISRRQEPACSIRFWWAYRHG